MANNAAQATNTPNGAPGRGPAALNPERPPQLLGKYSKDIGKNLSKIEVVYDTEGVNVYLYGKEGTPFYKESDGSQDYLTIAEYKAMKSEQNAPTDTEKLQSFRNKFEIRLNRAFPEEGPKSAADADIQAFLNGLPFKDRRALLMTQKQFEKQYPNGVPTA